MSTKTHCSDYLVDSSLAEEAIECRRHGYVLTGKFLGQGAYAKVYLGQPVAEKVKTNYKLRKMIGDHKEMKVAIKIISTATAPEIYITKFLPREVASMNKCYIHTNVIQLFDMFASRSRVYLVLEYAECGDLLTYVNQCYARKTHMNCLSEEKARAMFRDILAGIQFIHRRGVAHRDLKCENVLLAKNHRAKLSDFGFAVEARHSRELLQTHCGSYAYAPPEILRQQKYDGRLADLWSLGVILFAMVNGGLPFKESDAKAVLEAMKKPVYFKGYLTPDCKDLIRGLLRIKPHKRLSIAEVYAHSWMKKHVPPVESDKNASGDVTSQEPNLAICPEAGVVTDSRGIKYGDGFHNPENVLRYIKDCMGHLSGGKSHGRHYSESCNLHRPKVPTKPQFLHTVLACDPSGDPPPPKLPHPPEKPRSSAPTPNKHKIGTVKKREGSTFTPKVVTTPELRARLNTSVRLVQIDEGEMVVRGGSPRTTLPQVKKSGTKERSKTRNSERASTVSGSDITRRFKIKYEQKQTGKSSVSGSRSPPKRKYSKQIATDIGDAANLKSNATPNVINIKISNVLNRQHRTSGNREMTYVKVDKPMRKIEKTIAGSPKQDQGRPNGALSVPPPTEHTPKREKPTDKGVIMRPDKPKSCQTVQYNLTCSHSYRKNPGSSRKTLSISPLRSPPNRNSALPYRHYGSHAPQTEQQRFISVTPLNQSGQQTFAKDIRVTSRPVNRDDVIAGQAWSGNSPASTRTTGIAPRCQAAFRTSSQVTPQKRKLLYRRSQETRNVLNDTHATFVSRPTRDRAEESVSPFRAVLRMSNKRGL